MNRLVKINWGDGAYDLIEVNTDEEVSLINKMIKESVYLVGEWILDDICKKIPSAKVITEEVFEIETDVYYFSDDDFRSDSGDTPDYEEMERNERKDYADENFYTDVVSDIEWIKWPTEDEDVTVTINRIGDDKNGATKS